MLTAPSHLFLCDCCGEDPKVSLPFHANRHIANAVGSARSLAARFDEMLRRPDKLGAPSASQRVPLQQTTSGVVMDRPQRMPVQCIFSPLLRCFDTSGCLGLNYFDDGVVLWRRKRPETHQVQLLRRLGRLFSDAAIREAGIL